LDLGKRIQECNLLTILIATINNFEYLQQTIRTLKENTKVSIKIIIFDNGSADLDLLDYYEKNSDLTVIRSNKNIGYVKAINSLFPLVETKYTMFLNDDVIIYPDTIDRMFDILEKNEEIGLLGPVSNWGFTGQKISAENIKDFFEKSKELSEKYQNQTLKLLTISGFCLMFKTVLGRKISIKNNILDDIFGLGFWDDIDFCKRVIAENYSVEIALGVFIYHKSNVSFKKLRFDQNYLHQRNKKLFFQKWGENKIKFLAELSENKNYNLELKKIFQKCQAEWIVLLNKNEKFETSVAEYIYLYNNNLGYYFELFTENGVFLGYKLGIIRNIEKYRQFQKVKRDESFFIPEYNFLFFNTKKKIIRKIR